MTIEEYFENKIFEENHDSQHFEQVRLNMFNILETFSKNLFWFNSLSKQKKWDICELACLISIHGNLQQLNETTILFKKEKQFYRHSINRPNPKYEIINIETSETNKIIQIDYENKSNNTL